LPKDGTWSDQRLAAGEPVIDASSFLDSGGWGYGVGVVDGPVGRRYGWAGGLGTLWYSWPDHDLAVVLLTQVTPPEAEVFEAFTRTVERELEA
jgi:CubicO group peptidase (beta-lactamase class C family)